VAFVFFVVKPQAYPCIANNYIVVRKPVAVNIAVLSGHG